VFSKINKNSDESEMCDNSVRAFLIKLCISKYNKNSDESEMWGNSLELHSFIINFSFIKKLSGGSYYKFKKFGTKSEMWCNSVQTTP
jgi:hypothetical protein